MQKSADTHSVFQNFLTEGYSSPASDMWALGVIFYTILTGSFPFHYALFDDQPGIFQMRLVARSDGVCVDFHCSCEVVDQGGAGSDMKFSL